MCALSSLGAGMAGAGARPRCCVRLGAGAAAGCRCCVRLGAGAAAAVCPWTLLPLQGAAGVRLGALCAWEVGRWCHCRVPLLSCVLEETTTV